MGHLHTLAPRSTGCMHCSVASDTAARLRSAARDLATRINAGVMAEADSDDRCELRRLSLDMLEMADLLDGGAP